MKTMIEEGDKKRQSSNVIGNRPRKKQILKTNLPNQILKTNHPNQTLKTSHPKQPQAKDQQTQWTSNLATAAAAALNGLPSPRGSLPAGRLQLLRSKRNKLSPNIHRQRLIC